jgi:DNA repair exonuclease SbcCD ATPase subunit
MPSKRLARIQATGLKNLNDIDLMIGPLCMLAGPNGSGKTGLQQAVKLSVLGYEPSLGKQLLQVRTQLANGTETVETGLVFSDGFAIRRSFGASKETRVAPPKREATGADMEKRIRDELGGFVLSMDIRELLDLTPEKRREYVFGLLPKERATLTEDQFRAALGYDQQHTAVKKAIDKLWLEHLLQCETAVEGLASAIAHANRHALDAEQTRRQKEHHRQELEGDLEKAKAESAASYDPAVVEKLQDELGTAERELAEANERVRTAKEAHERAVSEYRRRLESAAREAKLVERQTLRAETLASLREQLEKIGAPQDDAELKARYEAARAHLDEVKEAEGEQVDAHSAALRVVSETKALLAAQQNTLREVEGVDACPTCGGTADLETFRERTRNEIARLEGELSKAEQKMAAEGSRRDTAHQLREKADEALARERDAYQNAARVKDHRANLVASIERAEADGQEIDRDLADVRKQIADAASVAEPKPLEEEDTSRFIVRVHELREQIRAEQAKAAAGSAPETIRAQIADAEQEEERARAREDALKDLHKRLQVLRGDVIQGMLAPVESTAQEILRQVDPEKEFRFQYDREGREVLDFGFEKGGAFRPFAAASNGESAILVAVLLAALMDDLAPPWRVLMLDNVEAIDDDPRTRSRERFMEALVKISGSFDNILLAGCGKSALEPVDGWEVIDVAELTGALSLAAVA